MIKINPAHKGCLHRMLGIKPDKKIPAKKLAVKKTDSAILKKRKIFAQNAKKWKH